MTSTANRVREITRSTGTGAITLGGVVRGFRTFSSAFADGASIWYVIDDLVGNWEVGIGTYTAGQINRDTVLTSSNSDALVSFTAGSKQVFATMPTEALNIANMIYNPAGAGAISETVETALRRLVSSQQYATAPEYQAARDALAGTVGLPSVDITGTLTIGGNATSSFALSLMAAASAAAIRSLLEIAYVINPKAVAYGAKGDGQTVSSASVSITSGTAALTVTGASFAAADAGKVIVVPGAGAAGAALITTILSVTDATHVTLASNASTTLSAVAKTIDYGTDDTTALQAAANAAVAGGGILVMPPGDYITTAAVTYSDAAVVLGSGARATIGTRIRIVHVTADAFRVETQNGCVFRDMWIDTPVTKTAGAGIKVQGATTVTSQVNRRTRIENITVRSMDSNIYMHQCANFAVRDCYLEDFITNGILVDTTASVPDVGDSIISGNTIWALNTTGSDSCIYMNPAAAVNVIGNKLLGAKYGVRLTATQGPTGTLIVVGNSMEEQNVNCVRVEQPVGGSSYGNIVVSNNELSLVSTTPQSTIVIVAGASAQYIKNVAITGNVVNNAHNQAYPVISVQDGANVLVANNNINSGSAANPTGITVGGFSSAVQVLDNIIVNTPGGKYAGGLTTTTVLRDRNGMTVSELGVWANGSSCYLTNGKDTGGGNLTVTSGGSGCIGWRMQGAWLTLPGLG